MSLKKQFLKSKPVCKVTFALTKEEAKNASEIKVLGDFNEWNTTDGVEMKKFKNGNFKATIDLAVNEEYQFKYLLDGEVWENDTEADKYVENGVSYDGNSVVVL